MKKLQTSPASFFCLILLFISSSSFAQNWMRNKNVNGNGNITSEKRTVSDFDEIRVSEGLTVVYKQGPKSVTVQADENLIEYIVTDVKDNKLIVERKGNLQFKKYKKVEVQVSSPELFAIETNSGADFESVGTISSSAMRLSASSGSDIDANIKAEKMKVNSSSGADINLTMSADMMDASSSSGARIDIQGSARSVKLSSSSGADINAKDLRVKNCDANASSAGSVSISVSDNLVANASSGGDINYYGSPTLDKATSSGGDITPH